jgi:serine/threonine protein kinase
MMSVLVSKVKSRISVGNAKLSDLKLGAREKTCWQCGGTFRTDLEVCPNDGARLIDIASEEQGDPLIGQVFDGRFRIYRKLGEGGMGTVYSARRLDFESDVALKLLKVDFARDDGIRKRFMYEARVISNLRHPHVVRLFDFGQTSDGHFYMVMELLEGESLADRLAYRFVTYREVFDIVPPICGVLGEAHTRDVIHRDLKPENIFLLKVEGNDEFPKLLDFGIAKHIQAETMTQSGTLWGTPAYMSPEQAAGSAVGGQADIYAIGIILYELISGNLPFNASTQMGYAVKHLNEPARPLSSIPGLEDVPAELDAFVLRLLSKSPEDRPATMEEVASTLFGIRERCFDEALLDVVPAERVDPIGLQQWLKSAPDASQPLPATEQSGRYLSPESVAVDTGERHTVAVVGQGMRAFETELRERSDSWAQPDVGTANSDGSKRLIVLGAMAAAILLVVIASVAILFTSGDPMGETILPDVAVQEPVDMTTVTGAAARQAARVIIEARSLATRGDSEDLILVDEVEVLERDGTIRTIPEVSTPRPAPAAPRPQAPRKEEKDIRRAIEGTF